MLTVNSTSQPISYFVGNLVPKTSWETDSRKIYVIALTIFFIFITSAFLLYKKINGKKIQDPKNISTNALTSKDPLTHSNSISVASLTKNVALHPDFILTKGPLSIHKIGLPPTNLTMSHFFQLVEDLNERRLVNDEDVLVMYTTDRGPVLESDVASDMRYKKDDLSAQLPGDTTTILLHFTQYLSDLFQKYQSTCFRRNQIRMFLLRDICFPLSDKPAIRRKTLKRAYFNHILPFYFQQLSLKDKTLTLLQLYRQELFQDAYKATAKELSECQVSLEEAQAFFTKKFNLGNVHPSSGTPLLGNLPKDSQKKYEEVLEHHFLKLYTPEFILKTFVTRLEQKNIDRDKADLQPIRDIRPLNKNSFKETYFFFNDEAEAFRDKDTGKYSLVKCLAALKNFNILV